MKFYTVGHSTRKIEEFISILKIYRIEVLVDIRAFPVSRRYPQFNKENLEESLSQNGMEYIWLGRELGGYRRKSDGLGDKSPNKGWETEGFRIYADYMQSDIFKRAVDKLLELAEEKTIAYMCAEKFYWRCHRRIVSDYLKALGHQITHIIEKGKTRDHELPDFARVRDGKLTYPSTRLLTKLTESS